MQTLKRKENKFVLRQIVLLKFKGNHIQEINQKENLKYLWVFVMSYLDLYLTLQSGISLWANLANQLYQSAMYNFMHNSSILCNAQVAGNEILVFKTIFHKKLAGNASSIYRKTKKKAATNELLSMNTNPGSETV